MINGALRPWGKPQWLFQMEPLRSEQWLLIGALSTQDRCLAILGHRNQSFDLAYAAFLEISESQSKFQVQCEERRARNRDKWQAGVQGAKSELLSFDLLEPVKRLQRQVGLWSSGAFKKSIILDVSCLPERYFFPMLRWLLASDEVENLIVTCMAPERYTDDELAFDPQEWAHIPTFGLAPLGDTPPVKNVVVGAGFLPFSLPEWLKKDYSRGSSIQVSMLFPFPAPPANIKRSWEFVRQVEVGLRLRDEAQLARVGANDIPGCFDRIDRITRHGSVGTIFAPFGPKAHSLAMCLQAIKTGAQVLYTQPTYYHPEYTTGIKIEAALPAGFAYAIRVNGINFY